ncbi:HXXEE domain-containing protein [Conexibacter sp. JD483]|uniref:HXXEE domain-containing protein n=1 Tax=unclassified Conexibacter TaxID=2627773 RepID=UPI002716ACB6|nr:MULTISPECIES: HXXEE domain-containing protein [unclassified Conexibacter]MDO8186282.1 HXXEE domain-containing protein [Conexibacter sp. CPCC 205706]MDO8197487.1 HXXEE domain-containing protein [Conexibacter sp. CPCC 205762]MDR9370270.1 HXXEE domain-containing protein [Conexibacter sp. JD483]
MAAFDRTHGRWPWLAGAAAPAATALLVARRSELRADLRWATATAPAALLWHQTEEWLWPGGFLPWMNREVIGAAQDEFPITRRDGLVINVAIGWTLAGATAVRGLDAPALAASALAVNVANGAMHVGLAARRRRWNPGAVTSATLFLPLGIAGLAAIARDPRGGRRPLAIGLAVGAASGIGTMAGMRARLRRSGGPR